MDYVILKINQTLIHFYLKTMQAETELPRGKNHQFDSFFFFSNLGIK